MPTYDFRCVDGHVFDRFFRKISDAPSELECPQCGKLATRQLSGGAGLVFKGSGFYLTDYGKNAHRKGGDSKPDASKPAEGGGEAKPAESKPAETKASDASSNNSKADGAKPGGTASGTAGSAPKTDK